ncbi:MAG: hypothetical protein WB760_06575 [Xanthobacteraceae bacterium]
MAATFNISASPVVYLAREGAILLSPDRPAFDDMFDDMATIPLSLEPKSQP